MENKTEKGFTLIELLISLVIIGILTAVTVASLNTSRNKANDTKIKASINNARTYSALFFSQNNTYDGFCDSENVNNVEIETNINSTTTCVDGVGGWGIESEMSTGLYYCADFSGFSTSTSAEGLSLTDFGCAENTGTSTDTYTVN